MAQGRLNGATALGGLGTSLGLKAAHGFGAGMAGFTRAKEKGRANGGP